MVSRQKILIKQYVKGQIQQSKVLDQIKLTKIMVANLKAEREPQLTVANTVDVTRTADLPCAQVSSGSIRCTHHTRVNPHL